MALVDDVKSKLDIVSVVERYVPDLQKSGRSFKARCPFHSEKTPSFFVFPERQSWRCFGACATGGDLFTFVMKVENIEFAEALKRLAAEAGVVLPSRERRQEGDALYQVNEAARIFFSNRLNSPQGKEAREYLLVKRKLSKETVEKFQLGLSASDPDRSGLLDYLASQGHEAERVALAGLAVQGEGGRYRDMFRGRLMFPIRDDRGNLAGFGGRSLDGSEPKYLNSSRSPVFDKGRILYGLDVALPQIRKDGLAVVVEGYMDVIGPHQQGANNVVASMGTALTEQQVALLRGAAKSVVLALDPDVAGQEATWRSLESSWRVFQRVAIARVRGATLYQRPDAPELKVAALPPGKDPDEIALEDPSRWATLVAEAVPLMEYLFSAASKRFDLSTPQNKRRVAELLFPLVTAMTEPFEQDHYFQRLAQLLGVSERMLQVSLGRPSQAQSRPRRDAAGRPAPAGSSVFSAAEHDPLEEYCLALLLQHPELGPQASGLSLEHFKRVENREVFTLWQKGVSINGTMEKTDQELAHHAERLLTLSLPPSDSKEREANLAYCAKLLEERRIREIKLEEELRLTQAPREEFFQEQDRILEINEKFMRLFRQG
ncbi:MAG: DNA primase [Chloroflexota bacterium]|nr:DNA primase [Chloroflexota bacterium]